MDCLQDACLLTKDYCAYLGVSDKTEFEIDDKGILHLRYTMKTPEDLAIKRISLGEEQTKHFDIRSGYLDLSSLRIEGVEMTAS